MTIRLPDNPPPSPQVCPGGLPPGYGLYNIAQDTSEGGPGDSLVAGIGA